MMFLYGQLQSPRPLQWPPIGRALRRALGFVSGRIETSASWYGDSYSQVSHACSYLFKTCPDGQAYL